MTGMMRSFLFSILFSILFITGAHAQEDFVADNVSFVLAERQKKPSNGGVFYTDRDLVYAGRFGSKVFLRRLDQHTMDEIWNIKIGGGYKFEGIRFFTDTAIVTSDGAVNLIGSGVNSTTNEMEIGFSKISTEGEIVQTDIIHAVPRVQSMNDYRIKLVHSNDKYHVFVVIAGLTAHKDNREVFVIWLDQDLSFVAMRETDITDGSDFMDANGYDDINDILYFTTTELISPASSRHNDSRTRFLYSIPLNQSQMTNRVLLGDENSRLYSHEVIVDPKSGEIILIGLRGKVGSSEINKLFYTLFEPKTLKNLSSGDYPLSEAVVNEIKDSHKKLDALLSGNSVSFTRPKVYFTEEGSLYAVFEDFSERTHRGQLVFHLDSKGKVKWQTYVPNYGLYKSKFILDEDGSLLIYSIVQCRYLGKIFPDIDVYNDLSSRIYGVVKFVVNQKGELQIVPLLNFRIKTYINTLDLVCLYNNRNEIYISHESSSFGVFKMVTRKITEKFN